MARKQKCEDCKNTLVDGVCPTPELHGIENEGIYTSTDKRQEDILKQEAEIDLKLLELKGEQSSAQRLARAAKTELVAVKEERDRALAELDVLAQASRQTPEWGQVRKDATNHYGSLLALFSDLHASEMVNPLEINDYNKYDLLIAEMRTMRFFTRTIKVARNYLAGVEYDGIYLALLGDLVSGDIHEELVETNECSTYEAVYTVVPWLVKGIEMFAEEFGKVHVVSAPGNHGRNSKKPRHKKRSENNADTLIAKLVARDMRSADNITFDIPKSSDVGWNIYGYEFTGEHGDNLRFPGTSEIGALGPVKRGTGRMSRQMQELGQPFKYSTLGHFHQFIPAYTQGFIMNGSIKGYDEYAKDGKFAPEIAQQGLVVVTPEHGITVTAPVFVADRDAEGW
jgi:hypothetical protein